MSQTNKRIYLSPPHMGEEEKKFVDEAFASNWIAPCGPQQEKFEKEMADYLGGSGTVALSSGTAAVHLALRLLGVGQGDIVFCASLTFIGSASPILFLGAVPVFIDSEPSSWNMSPDALQRAFTDAEKQGKIPKAVVVVNLYGQSADMDALLEICGRYGVPVLEDAAESLGATYKDNASGTLGRFGVLSFNGNKIITTSGGGMLVSRDLKALEKARYWATQAREPVMHFEHKELGYNYRMSNVLAGIGRGQLRVLDARVEARRKIHQRYVEAFSDLPELEFMPEATFGRCTRWLTVLILNKEKCGVEVQTILDALESQNIEGRPVWKPLHNQPLFEGTRFYPHEPGKNFCEHVFLHGFCLPSGSGLEREEQQRVIDVVRTTVKPLKANPPQWT